MQGKAAFKDSVGGGGAWNHALLRSMKLTLCTSFPSLLPPLLLRLRQVIALINLLGRFSHSLATHHRLSQLLAEQRGVALSISRSTPVV
jgi:hypothetical protein